MKTVFNKTEKKEIINDVINLFMNEWKDEYSRHEIYIEYKLKNRQIIEIRIDSPVSYDDNEYIMTIDLHNPAPNAMTWRYNMEFTVGRMYNTYDDGYVNWNCDNTIIRYIKTGINNIFRGLLTEK
jgi:hypothetical protein